MIKVVIAPDSFTEWKSAQEAGSVMAEEARAMLSEKGIAADVLLVPMADGGTGTAAVLGEALGGQWRSLNVKDPLGEPHQVSYLVLTDGSVCLELARASGIELLKSPTDRRHPFLASTFGTGEMILDAYGRGARRILVTLGGSGTNDGGVGLSQALGVELLDDRGLQFPDRYREGYGALALMEGEGAHGARFTRRLDLRDVDLRVACDVDNPLVGTRGASVVFGPQKGATEAMIPLLDQALARWAGWVEAHLGSAEPERLARILPPSGRIHEIPGSGAAGGAAFALHLLFGARLVPGAELVGGAVGLDEKLEDADLVLTGEGRIDRQSFMGKVVGHVSARAKALAPLARVVAIGGTVAGEVVPHEHLDHVVDAASGATLGPDEIGCGGETRLRQAVREAIDWWLASPSSKS